MTVEDYMQLCTSCRLQSISDIVSLTVINTKTALGNF